MPPAAVIEAARARRELNRIAGPKMLSFAWCGLGYIVTDHRTGETHGPLSWKSTITFIERFKR